MSQELAPTIGRLITVGPPFELTRLLHRHRAPARYIAIVEECHSEAHCLQTDPPVQSAKPGPNNYRRSVCRPAFAAGQFSAGSITSSHDIFLWDVRAGWKSDSEKFISALDTGTRRFSIKIRALSRAFNPIVDKSGGISPSPRPI